LKYYLAPLEGVTTWVYRKAQSEVYGALDKYFIPFLEPHEKRNFNTRELQEIDPEHNRGMYVVPQILTNKADGFISLCQVLKEYGYEEVNLNLGCPSKTVVSKNKGSGFLAMPDELDDFLEQIFSKVDMKISIKTRIGKLGEDEFD
jgi:tRNA-dihydrouridine synthase